MREYPGTSPLCCRKAVSTQTILQRCHLQQTVALCWPPFKISAAHQPDAKSNAFSSELCWPADDAPWRSPETHRTGRHAGVQFLPLGVQPCPLVRSHRQSLSAIHAGADLRRCWRQPHVGVIARFAPGITLSNFVEACGSPAFIVDWFPAWGVGFQRWFGDGGHRGTGVEWLSPVTGLNRADRRGHGAQGTRRK